MLLDCLLACLLPPGVESLNYLEREGRDSRAPTKSVLREGRKCSTHAATAVAKLDLLPGGRVTT